MFADLFEDRKGEDPLQLSKDATSLDLLRIIYRCPDLGLPVRMRAAIAALPFEHPKLMVTAQVSESDFATLLDRRIKRFEELKMIEQQPPPTNGAAVEVKPPRVPDRRFRRI
jgi:hypothetical protein